MKAFLFGLYIEHGDRDFEYSAALNMWPDHPLFHAVNKGYVQTSTIHGFKITPKAMGYIKSDAI